MRDLFQSMEDLEEKYWLMKRLNFQIMKLNMMRRTSPLLEENQVYYEKILDRLSQKDSPAKKDTPNEKG